MQEKAVLILLSTYNGEKYLQEQLDSLMNQKNVLISVLVRDDGSSDNTLKILRQFQKDFDHVSLMEENNIGCANSFLRLLNAAGSMDRQFDYYAFCDQDDIWLENKLFTAVCKLNKLDKSLPLMYCGHFQMVTEEMVKIPTKPRKLSCSFGEAMVTNAAVGCTSVFNRKLLDLANLYKPTCPTMHDSWIYRICLATGGEVYYDKNYNILYRQHSNNVIGGSPSIWRKWRRRLRLFCTEQKNIRQQIARNILKGYDPYISEYDKALLLQIINYRSSLNSKMQLLLNRRFITSSIEHNFMFRMAVILEKY